MQDNGYKSLRMCRKICDLSLDDVASRVPLSAGYLNRLERGRASLKNPLVRAALDTYLHELRDKVRTILEKDGVLDVDAQG